jgi:hypothetical protein
MLHVYSQSCNQVVFFRYLARRESKRESRNYWLVLDFLRRCDFLGSLRGELAILFLDEVSCEVAEPLPAFGELFSVNR